MDADFDGVSHRRELYDSYLGARDNAHIEKMLTERTFAADSINNAGFTCF